jgi:dTDP-4-amino-4,6-dideoxygalactose transaminase
MIKEIRSTLKSRWWGQGPKVDEFEKRFGDKFWFDYCVMTNSGTAALHLAYILAGIKSGDEVIVPVLTCTATCHPLKAMGARIVFADINKDTLCLDPASLKRKITRNTKAVVVVHLGGYVDYDLGRICLKENIPIIEDAAQALGSSYVGLGNFTCFSFQAIKALSTGDGGMLRINSAFPQADELYQRAKRLRWFSIDREAKAQKNWQAWDRRGITFDQDELGYKYQPTDIDASIGLAALRDFDRNQDHRHKLVDLYRALLANAPQVELLRDDSGNAHWLFMVLVNGDRDSFAEHLARNGIETNVAHIRNDIFKVFGGYRRKLPNMDAVESHYLCLPLNNNVNKRDVKYICKKIKEWKVEP